MERPQLPNSIGKKNFKAASPGESHARLLLSPAGNLGRPWFRYSVEESFRKAVIARNGRKKTKNTRCSFHCNSLILGKVARPERFELPVFWALNTTDSLFVVFSRFQIM